VSIAGDPVTPERVGVVRLARTSPQGHARHDPREATISANPDLAERVRATVEPAVAASGLVLEDVVIAATGRRSLVRVVVDLPDDAVGGLGSDRLAEVSRGVSAAMDSADAVRGAYTLEVSTPGTDRPLTELRHFRRARTRLVRMVLRDGTTVAGRLTDAEAAGYELSTSDGVRRVDPGDVVSAVVEVELRDDAAEEGGV
jgi:ribosome maturation factor RimP